MFRVLFLSIFFLTVTSWSVLAAPVNYDEAIHGDLDDNQFTLDVGSNIVSGTVTIQPYDDPSDPFYVVLPTGLVINAITLDVLGVNASDGSESSSLTFGGYVETTSPQLEWFIDDNIKLKDTAIFSFLNSPLFPGQYGVSPNFNASGFETGDLSVDYRWTFDVYQVSSIPLPTTLPLFVSALFIMGAVGWKRRQKVDANM
ncbi:MAG: hypothetical protein JKX94_06990 [Sneathiella sp.]|nr:hypothetical protein [Sneathiella sp.]